MLLLPILCVLTVTQTTLLVSGTSTCTRDEKLAGDVCDEIEEAVSFLQTSRLASAGRAKAPQVAAPGTVAAQAGTAQAFAVQQVAAQQVAALQQVVAKLQSKLDDSEAQVRLLQSRIKEFASSNKETGAAQPVTVVAPQKVVVPQPAAPATVVAPQKVLTAQPAVAVTAAAPKKVVAPQPAAPVTVVAPQKVLTAQPAAAVTAAARQKVVASQSAAPVTVVAPQKVFTAQPAAAVTAAAPQKVVSPQPAAPVTEVAPQKVLTAQPAAAVTAAAPQKVVSPQSAAPVTVVAPYKMFTAYPAAAVTAAAPQKVVAPQPAAPVTVVAPQKVVAAQSAAAVTVAAPKKVLAANPAERRLQSKLAASQAKVKLLEQELKVQASSNVQTGSHSFFSESCPLYVGIMSAPLNKKRRAAVRSAYLDELRQFANSRGIITEFIIGHVAYNQEAVGIYPNSTELQLEHDLNAEAVEHGDIQRIGVPEKDQFLPDKTLNFLQRGVNKKCAFIMKIDDDQILNMTSTIDFLETKDPQQLLYAGKSYMPRQFYESQSGADGTFTPYFSGPSYLMSWKLAHQIVEVHADHTAMFTVYGSSSEDVDVGHWVQWEAEHGGNVEIQPVWSLSKPFTNQTF